MQEELSVREKTGEFIEEFRTLSGWETALIVLDSSTRRSPRWRAAFALSSVRASATGVWTAS